ncbi:Hypothetical predicted protein, partial [Olea europaea subsp. europaea]
EERERQKNLVYLDFIVEKARGSNYAVREEMNTLIEDPSCSVVFMGKAIIRLVQ